MCVDQSFLKLVGITDMFVYLMGYLDKSSIRSLCNSSVQLQHSKYCFVRWNLTKSRSMEYVKNVPYRESLLQRMSMPLRQLSLNLDDCTDSISNISVLGCVHTLHVSKCWRLVDVSALGTAHTLFLSWCSQLVDVSALGTVHTLNLSHCRHIVDVSALGSVHSLNLSWCSQLVDVVSALGTVHTLNLSKCHGLVDVSVH